MTQNLIILGAGGNSLGIIDAVECCNAKAQNPVWRLIGILDDLDINQGRKVLGYPVLGRVANAKDFQHCSFINGISSINSFRHMPEIVRRTGIPTERFATIVHPDASVARTATLGFGVSILAGSRICPDARIGDHCIILQNTSVNHHSVLAPFVTLSAGITILGNVQIGENAFISGGSTLIPSIRVGAGAVVGAGSTVIRDVADGTVVAGAPARPLPASRYRSTP